MGYLSNSVFILQYVFHNLCTLITMLKETKFIIVTLSTNYQTKFPYLLRSFVVYRIHSFGKKRDYFIVLTTINHNLKQKITKTLINFTLKLLWQINQSIKIRTKGKISSRLRRSLKTDKTLVVFVMLHCIL